MTDRENILKQLEYWSELRGQYTMVGDWCSAAIVSKTIGSLYRQLNPDYWSRLKPKTPKPAETGQPRSQR